MIVKYVPPVIAVMLILLFYLGLPWLGSCEVPELTGDRKRLDRKDALLAAAIALIYAIVAFTNLGNTQSPQTYVTAEQGGIVLETEKPVETRRMRVFTWMTVGSWNVDFSDDGENWYYAGVIDQNYAAILKWQDVDLSEAPAMETKYIRLTGDYGSPALAELYAEDWDGTAVQYAAGPAALYDEQALVPETQTFMNSSYFDEIYHVRTAIEHLKGMEPYEISHPPLGKLIIGLGISIFGVTPFGWRFMGTLFGVLMLVVMYVFAKRLFGGREVPALCEVLFAADFMHFTQTRLATIDTYAVFWILLMYLFMWEFIERGSYKALGLSGLFFGLGAATKWTCIYAGAGLGLIWVMYWIVHGKEKGFREFARNSLFCIGTFVLVPAVIYYLAYTPYGTARGMHGIGMYFRREYMDIVLSNQQYMFSYHSGVTATHPYSSWWYQWVLDIRPILYYLSYGENGTRSSFGAFLNPFICWGGLLALFVLGAVTFMRSEKKSGFLLLGYLAQLVPWMFVTRVVFEYHYFPCSVFLILALGYVFEIMRRNVKEWRWYCYGFTGVTAATFWLFYPAVSGAVVKAEFAAAWLKWLPTWPF